jgi:hypothetical protein
VSKRRSLSWLASWLALGTLAAQPWAGGTARAQAPAGAVPAAPPPAALPDSIGGVSDPPDALAADQLFHLSRHLLAGPTIAGATVAGQQKPRREQMLCARALLAPAVTLRPGDTELTRSLIELDTLLDDRAAAAQTLAEYCKLRPDDDVAQRDLILLRVQGLQTLEQRAAAFEAVLDDPAARALTPALRGRLAFYASECWHEAGNESRRFARLRQAAELDSTAKPVMQAILDLVAQRAGTPQELAVALGGVLGADPLDLTVRRQLADLLLSQAAYPAAARQYEVLENLGAAQGDPRYFDFYWKWSVCQAAGGLSQSALVSLAKLEALAAVQVAQPTTPPTTEPTTQPAEPATSLTLPQQRAVAVLRLAILSRSGAANLDPLEALRSRKNLFPTAADDPSPGAEFALWQLVLGSQPLDDQAMTALTATAQALGSRLRLIQGWQLLRRGQVEDSRRVFTDLGDREPFALYGLAETLKAAGQENLRKEQLARVIGAAPASVAAVLAAGDLAALHSLAAPTPQGAAAERVLRGLPRIVCEPNPQREPWITVAITTPKDQYRYLEPMTATVRLRNVSDVPLSLSDGGALPPRAALVLSEHLLSDDPRIAVALIPERMPPSILDLGRRLRLAPRETIEVPVRLDWTYFGRRLAEDPLTVSFGAQVVFDPLFQADGAVQPGPVGAVADLLEVHRSVPGMTPENLRNAVALRALVDQWEAALAGPAGPRRVQALAMMVRVSSRLPGNADLYRAARQEMSTHLGQAFGGLQPGEQVVVVSLLPPQALVPIFHEVHELAGRSDQPLVRMAYLATQVSDAGSALLTDALRSTNPQVHDYAQWMHDYLQAQADTAAGAAPPAPAGRP